jgi:hypothetical protein
MPQLKVSSLLTGSLHHLPLMKRLFHMFDLSSLIHIRRDVLEYLVGSLTLTMISLTLVTSIHQ